MSDTDHYLRPSCNRPHGKIDQRSFFSITERIKLPQTAEKEQPVQPCFNEMIDMPLHIGIIDAAVVLHDRNDG